MVCYHPRKMVPVGLTENKRIRYEFFNNRNEKADEVFGAITVPCGQCIGCRLEYSRQWAMRMMLEAKDHEETWFLTLTYNDENVPVNEWIDFDTGEVNESLTLRKRDWQLFNKRFRKQQDKLFGRKVRFFMSGEYGDQYSRPHFHAILFGAHFDDLQVYCQKGNYTYYNSELLDRCWNHRGFAVLAEATFETCAYVGRYVTKKLTGKLSSFYREHGLDPEFALMSRRPGIARKYYDEHKKEFYNFCSDWQEDFVPENIVLPDGKSLRPPRYFDKLFEFEDPAAYGWMKEQRKEVVKDLQALKSDQTDLQVAEQLLVSEHVCENRLKGLQRRFENGTYEK